MFTGIIETVGTVEKVETHESNRIIWISSAISHDLRPDQSVSHDGVCLTVDEIMPGSHRVTVIAETLSKSSLGEYKQGSRVNIERSLPFNGRLDGHFVQGHVDAVGSCIERNEVGGSVEFTIQFPAEFAANVVEKGSIAVNGISLTVFNVAKDQFTVAIIPYTLTHTTIGALQQGGKVNLEFDILGKYISRLAELKNLKD